MEQLMTVTGGLSSVWQLILYIFGTIIASSIVIEISPIKINPISLIGKHISKGIKGWFKDIVDDSLEKSLESVKEDNKKRDDAIVKMDGAIGSLTEKVDQITARIDANENRAQANHIAAVRRSILQFSNQLRDGMDASKESFDDILDQYDEYEEYVKANEISNGRMTMSIQLIREVYQQKFNHLPEKS